MTAPGASDATDAQDARVERRRRRRLRRRIAWIGALGVYLAALLFGRLTDRVLMHPWTAPIDAHGADRRELLVNGRTVEAWVARSPGAREAGGSALAVVLEFCGNGTRAEQIATYAAGLWGDVPVEVWTVNHPGYGGTPGPARIADLPGLAVGTYDALRARAGDRPVFVGGNSLGSALALHVAAHRPAAGLFLRNPPPLRAVILRRYGWWNAWLLAGPIAMGVPSALDSPANAARVAAPAVFVSGRDDGLVPPKYHRMVIDRYAGEARVLTPAMAHVDRVPTDAEADVRDALRWLWAHRREPAGR